MGREWNFKNMKMTEVVAALIWQGDQFMICKRPAHKARGLLWEFVGGKVEQGETKEQALIRECREELAVTLSVGDVFMDVIHEYPDLTVHLTLFNATIAEGVPQKLEHDDIRWITPSEIPGYEFCPADEEILAKIQRKSDMTNEIIKLLPSADCKGKIIETNHRFKESELLEIIYTYAPSFDARLDLLGRFAEIASSDVSALAKAYIEYEQETFARFVEAPENVVYELHIKTTPDAWDENYLCSSYHAALACINKYYEEYADFDVKETERTRYKILKRKIFFEGDKFDTDAASECVLGPNKTVLAVSDYQNYFENFCKKRGFTPPDNDDVMYPCFVKDLAPVKYTESDGKEHFGVCLCGEFCKKSCGLIDYLYVLPLDGTTIRDRRFEDDFYDHEHIALPEVTLASSDDLDETMRKNYFAFISFWNEQKHE